MYNFKSLLAGVIVAAFCIQACAPIENSTADNSQNPVSANERQNSATESYQRNSIQETTNEADDERITLSYTNQSSGIEIKLDPESDQFFLDLSGMKPAEKDTVVIADSALMEKNLKDIQEVLAKFRQAQDLFYIDEYSRALTLLNETLEIAETADAYALKGTIHFMMGNKNATRENWNRAVQINPDLPIPSIPELENIIEDIIAEEEAESVEQEVTEEEEQE